MDLIVGSLALSCSLARPLWRNLKLANVQEAAPLLGLINNAPIPHLPLLDSNKCQGNKKGKWGNCLKPDESTLV